MSKKRSGFSLVELLAVIILLGIIALIIVPSALKTLENSKKESFQNSVVGLITSATNYMGESDFDEWPGGLTIAYIKTNNLFEAKNIENFTSGIIYNNNGTISVVGVTDGNYCASGKKNSLTITEGMCYEMDTINLSDFDNWRSGQYSIVTGIYGSYASRICLNDYITVEPGVTYEVTISNSNYNLLFRALAADYTYISSYNIATGGSFIIPSHTAYLGISLYNATSEIGLSYTTYSDLFASGLNITVSKQ